MQMELALFERESLWKLVISRKFGKEGGGWSSRELGRAIGWGFGRKLERKVLCCLKMFPSLWGM